MSGMERAIIAGGCFWCTEAVFRDVVGVQSVESGYIGGTKPNPTYKEVCTGSTGHAEGILVTFDPHAISLGEIYDVFLGTHDPTQLNRQGNDIGTQYRSAIFPLSDEQGAEAEAAIARWNAENGKQAVTTIEGLTGGVQTAEWYPAEDYHQNYFNLNANQGYCRAVIIPKLKKFEEVFSDIKK